MTPLPLDDTDHNEEGGHPDRWLISYADFITLLLGLFVVLYAMSSIQENKYAQLHQSMRTALGQDESPVTPENPAIEPLTELATQLKQDLADLIKTDVVTIAQSNTSVSIQINASILFDPGDAQLQVESIQSLNTISATLQKHPYPIHVIGHTDNIDIHSKTFPSNWELSAARASRVVRLMEANGIASQRLQAIGLADTRPLASNSHAEGRMKNRRVEITIQSVDLKLAT